MLLSDAPRATHPDLHEALIAALLLPLAEAKDATEKEFARAARHVLGPDYNRYMDRQQAINLGLHAFFGEEGIEFAFPTQTLYLKNDDAKLDQVLEGLAVNNGHDALRDEKPAGATST